MARTIAEIQAEIITAVQNDTTLSPQLTSISVTAIWRLWTYIVAVSIWTLEVLFDLYRTEITELVASKKPHTLRWYQSKALAYQHGGTLSLANDEYNNTGLTDDQIAEQKIIAEAAVTEVDNILYVKVQKSSGDDLAELDLTETEAFTAYMTEVKDAGVKMIVRSVPADHLKIEVDVYYDATILSSDGARLDGTASTPVQDAAKAFLRELPFDGKYIKAHHVDALQAVEGVIVPEFRLCQTRRDDDPSFANVDVFYDPYSGFLKFYDEETDLVLNFIPA